MGARCAHMVAMRAALGILCLQCVLLTGTASETAIAAAPPPAIPTAKAALAPGAAKPGPNPSQPLSPQDLLFACPTTLDHIGRVVASVMVDGKGPFRFIIDTGANHSTISSQLAAVLGLRSSMQQSIRVTGVTGPPPSEALAAPPACQ